MWLRYLTGDVYEVITGKTQSTENDAKVFQLHSNQEVFLQDHFSSLQRQTGSWRPDCSENAANCWTSFCLKCKVCRFKSEQ